MESELESQVFVMDNRLGPLWSSNKAEIIKIQSFLWSRRIITFMLSFLLLTFKADFPTKTRKIKFLQVLLKKWFDSIFKETFRRYRRL